MWYWYILIGIVLITLIVLISYNYLKGSNTDSLLSGESNLETTPQIGNTSAAQQILNNSNTGSLQIFVYPTPIQRTGTYTICTDSILSESGSSTTGSKECSTGRFGICECDSTDCSKCVHSGYVNIINVSNVVRLELLASPDAGRQESASVQLVLRCKKPNKIVEETFVLPNIKLQKWTMVTISREGRRFDIYYNDKLVLSKRTQYILDNNSVISPIIAGDKMLNGKVALVKIFPTKLSSVDITNIYKSNTDTNGMPLISKSNNILNNITSNICKNGSCFQGPTVRPASPLLDWDTQYA